MASITFDISTKQALMNAPHATRRTRDMSAQARDTRATDCRLLESAELSVPAVLRDQLCGWWEGEQLITQSSPSVCYDVMR